MNKKRVSSYDDLQENIRTHKLPAIEVWENKYQDKDYVISLDCPEFTCICPKTGLPDFGIIKIDYSPDKLCIELKSFKMYLVAYRDVGIFHEHLVNKILEDFVAASKPKWAKVEGIVNARGGIQTTVVAEYKISKPR